MKWHAQNTVEFQDTNKSPDPDQMIRPCVNYEKQKTCCLEDFSFPVLHTVKIIKKRKDRHYLDLAREVKNTVEQ